MTHEEQSAKKREYQTITEKKNERGKRVGKKMQDGKTLRDCPTNRDGQRVGGERDLCRTGGRVWGALKKQKKRLLLRAFRT